MSDNPKPEGIGHKDGRSTQNLPDTSRGSSVQGEMQRAKGGPAGANQGGAPRGGSRLEPSHQKEQQKQDKGGAQAPGGRSEPKKPG